MPSTCEKRASSNAAPAAEITAPVSAEHADRPKHLSIDERARMRIISLIARNARAACGMTQAELARAMGLRREQLVHDWENANTPAAPRTDHILRAPVAYRRYWARELAALDGDVVTRRLRVVHAIEAQRTAALVKELGDVSTAHAVDAADGNIDDPVALLQHVHEARDVLDELEAKLRAVIESGRLGR